MLADAQCVDWSMYNQMEELVGESDYFVLDDGPPENAIELCQHLLYIGQP